METRPKSSNANQKEAKKLVKKSENLFISKKSKERRDALKTRGLYVVRNSAELKVNDHYDEKNEERMPSKMLSQRKFSSSVVTDSFAGNRKFFTHEVIKTRKKKNINTSRKERLILNNNQTEENKTRRERIVSRNKNNIDDGIVYVMPSRGNNNRSLTITDSSMSKRDSIVSKRDSSVRKGDSVIKKRDSVISRQDLKNSSSSFNEGTLLSESFCAGIDRIATEVLEGWMKRKEKEPEVNNHMINEQVDDGLYDLCVDLVETTLNETDSKIYQEATTSKQNEKRRKTVLKKTTFQKNHEDHDYNVSKKFIITESKDTIKPKSEERKSKIKENRNLNFSNNAIRKLRQQSSKKSSSFDTNKKNDRRSSRRNGRKNFLDTIKRELNTGYNFYEEPRNMFEALKALANNKKRTKQITFEGLNRRIDDTDSNCELRSPNLLQRIPKKNYPAKNRSRESSKNSFHRQDYGVVPTLQIQNFYHTPDRVHVITT